MASDLGVAYIQVVPSTEGIQGSIQAALGSGDGVGEKLGSSISGGIGAGLKKGLAVAGAAGGAAVLAGKALFDFTSSAAAAGDAIDKQSQKIGVTAEQYQLLAFAAERSGTSVSTMTTAAKSLANSGFEGSVYDALSAVASIADEEERAAMATELFGTKAAMELTPMLAGGIEGLQGMYDECVALGGVMSDENVAASASFADSLTNMKTAITGVKNGLAGELMPSFTTVINGFASLVAGNDDAAEQIGTGVSSIVQSFSDSVPQILGSISGIITALAEQAPQIISSLIVGIVSALPSLVASGGDIVIAIVDGVIKSVPQLVAAAPKLINGLYNALKGIGSKMVSIGTDVVKGIWQGISGSLAWIKSQISGWVGNVKEFLKNLFDIHSPSRWARDVIGRNIALGAGLGFSDGMDDVNKMIEDSVQKDFNVSTTVGMNSAIRANSAALGSFTSSASSFGDTSTDRIVAAIAGLKESGIITVEDPNKLFRLIRGEQRKALKAGVAYV